MERNDFFIAEVAKLYYIDKIKQQDIAKRFNVTPMLISRTLKEAEEREIVTFHVKMPWKTDVEKGKRIKDKYNLKECLVLHVNPDEDERNQLSRFVADFFLNMHRNTKIMGISWGKTISKFAEALPYTRFNDLTILQLTGSFYGDKNYSVTPTGIMKNISEKLNSKVFFSNAPLYAANEEMCRLLISDEVNHQIHELSNHSELNIFGASVLDKESTTVKMGIITEGDFSELQQKGAIGDVAGTFIDKHGEEIQWAKSKLYTGVPLTTIAKATHAVCIASEGFKCEVIAVAARKKYFNTLITTEALADRL